MFTSASRYANQPVYTITLPSGAQVSSHTPAALRTAAAPCAHRVLRKITSRFQASTSRMPGRYTSTRHQRG